jgi:putative component of toxin-antitoxin plasmid stabilization module
MTTVNLFYDFVDAKGVNIIRDWLDGLDPKAKAKVNARLNVLEQMDHVEWIRTNYVEILTGDKDGLIAIRLKYNRIQYRLLGYYGPDRGEVTLLVVCTERNDKYTPLGAHNTAFNRIGEVDENPTLRKVRHEFR